MVSRYQIPKSLRGKPDIDEVLKFARYNPDAERQYIKLLQSEVDFKERFYSEYCEFTKQYRHEKPKNTAVKTEPLYKTMAERRESYHFDKAVFAYWFLLSAAEEYQRVTQTKSQSQSRNNVPNYSTSLQVNRSDNARNKGSVLAGAATVHVPGRQHGVGTVLMQDHRDLKTIEEQNKHLNQLLIAQGEDIKELNKREKENLTTIEDLRNRLSGFASKQLTEGNPNFTDLSDKNRPTKIAENFHNVYDEEWTNALEVLSAKRQSSRNEEEAIYILMDIIKTIYTFCIKVEKEQTLNILTNILRPCGAIPMSDKEFEDKKKIVTDLERQIVNMRRAHCYEPISSIIQKYKESFKEFQLYKMYPEVVKYTEKCVEYIWLMRSSDPPIVLKWAEQGDRFDVNLYNHYTKKGDRVDMAVWPVVFLHEGGPIMHKGYARPM